MKIKFIFWTLFTKIQPRQEENCLKRSMTLFLTVKLYSFSKIPIDKGDCFLNTLRVLFYALIWKVRNVSVNCWTRSSTWRGSNPTGKLFISLAYGIIGWWWGCIKYCSARGRSMFGGGVGLDCTLSHELVSPFHIIRVHALS